MKKIIFNNISKKYKKVNESTFGGSIAGLDATMSPANYNVQGDNFGYRYAILPFNTTLQQPANKIANDSYIHPGCRVKGKSFYNKKIIYTGLLMRIVKKSDGSIYALYVKDDKTNKFVTLSPDDIILLENKKIPQTLSSPFNSKI